MHAPLLCEKQWACHGEVPNKGWPINTFGGDTFHIGGKPTCIETDLNFAFDSFWQNSPVKSATTKKVDDKKVPFTLWELYGAMLQFVSSYLSDQQGNILGYDPINEPEPGSKWMEGYQAPDDPYNLFNFPNGCAGFDVDDLGAFYQQCAIPSLRAGHPEAMIWFEPNIYFDYNAPTFLPDLNTTFGNLGFNFHNYDNFGRFANPVRNALSYRTSSNVPLLCSEFGGSLAYGDFQAVQNINDSNLNQKMLTTVTHVYPRVTAGTPPEGFHTLDGAFSFKYTNQLPNGQIATGVTRIVVPAGLYPDGFDVTAPGATITRGDGLVELVVDSPTPTTINVNITPVLVPRP